MEEMSLEEIKRFLIIDMIVDKIFMSLIKELMYITVSF